MGIHSASWDRAKGRLAESESGYYRRRAVEERAVALECLNPRVRQAHLDMADRYDDLGRASLAFEHHLAHQLEVVD